MTDIGLCHIERPVNRDSRKNIGAKNTTKPRVKVRFTVQNTRITLFESDWEQIEVELTGKADIRKADFLALGRQKCWQYNDARELLILTNCRLKRGNLSKLRFLGSGHSVSVFAVSHRRSDFKVVSATLKQYTTVGRLDTFDYSHQL